MGEWLQDWTIGFIGDGVINGRLKSSTKQSVKYRFGRSPKFHRCDPRLSPTVGKLYGALSLLFGYYW